MPQKEKYGSLLFCMGNMTGYGPGMVSFCCAKLFEGLSDRCAGQPSTRFHRFDFAVNINF